MIAKLCRVCRKPLEGFFAQTNEIHLACALVQSSSDHADDTIVHGSGAKSSHTHAWDEIPTSALRSYVDRTDKGVARYGRDNYKKGLPWRGRWNHAMEHLLRLRERLERGERYDPTKHDDDAGALLWFAGFVCWNECEASEEVKRIFYGEEDD